MTRLDGGLTWYPFDRYDPYRDPFDPYRNWRLEQRVASLRAKFLENPESMVPYGRLTDRIFHMKGGRGADEWADPPLRVLTTQTGKRWVDRAKNAAAFLPSEPVSISAIVNFVADELTFAAEDEETPQQKARRLIKDDPGLADKMARLFLGLQDQAEKDLHIQGMTEWMRDSDGLLLEDGLPTRNASDEELRASASQSNTVDQVMPITAAAIEKVIAGAIEARDQAEGDREQAYRKAIERGFAELGEQIKAGNDEIREALNVVVEQLSVDPREAEVKQLQKKVQDARYCVGIVTTLLGFSDPTFARNFDQAANGALQAYEGIAMMAIPPAAVTPVGMYMAVQGFAQVLGAFGRQEDATTAQLQQIMGMLGVIDRKINAIAEGIAALHDKVDDLLRISHWQAGFLTDSAKQLEDSLRDIVATIEGVQQARDMVDIARARQHGVNPKAKKDTVVGSIEDLLTYALKLASIHDYTREDLNLAEAKHADTYLRAVPRTGADGSLDLNGFGVERMFGVLSDYLDRLPDEIFQGELRPEPLRQRLESGALQDGAGAIAPDIWAEAASAATEVLYTHLDVRDEHSAKLYEQVVKAGLWLVEVSDVLRSRAVLEAALEEHRRNAGRLVAAIAQAVEKHLIELAEPGQRFEGFRLLPSAPVFPGQQENPKVDLPIGALLGLHTDCEWRTRVFQMSFPSDDLPSPDALWLAKVLGVLELSIESSAVVDPNQSFEGYHKFLPGGGHVDVASLTIEDPSEGVRVPILRLRLEDKRFVALTDAGDRFVRGGPFSGHGLVVWGMASTWKVAGVDLNKWPSGARQEYWVHEGQLVPAGSFDGLGVGIIADLFEGMALRRGHFERTSYPRSTTDWIRDLRAEWNKNGFPTITSDEPAQGKEAERLSKAIQHGIERQCRAILVDALRRDAEGRRDYWRDEILGPWRRSWCRLHALVINRFGARTIASPSLREFLFHPPGLVTSDLPVLEGVDDGLPFGRELLRIAADPPMEDAETSARHHKYVNRSLTVIASPRRGRGDPVFWIASLPLVARNDGCMCLTFL